MCLMRNRIQKMAPEASGVVEQEVNCRWDMHVLPCKDRGQLPDTRSKPGSAGFTQQHRSAPNVNTIKWERFSWQLWTTELSFTPQTGEDFGSQFRCPSNLLQASKSIHRRFISANADAPQLELTRHLEVLEISLNHQAIPSPFSALPNQLPT